MKPADLPAVVPVTSPEALYAWPGARPKWWTVEVRCARRLTMRQVRRLSGLAEYLGGHVGVDGAAFAEVRLPTEWEAESLLHVLGSLPGPVWIRALPRGARCPGATCPRAEGSEVHRCEAGDWAAADPVWAPEDWREVPHGS